MMSRPASVKTRNTAPITADTTQPAAMPAQVFFGLTRGQNFGPPISRPAKYPAISVATTSRSANSNQTMP